jgi:hypothetical protein
MTTEEPATSASETPTNSGKTRRAGRPKGSKNKKAAAPKKRKSRRPVYKLPDGTTLPPPDQLPAAYLFECAVYATELKNKLPSL